MMTLWFDSKEQTMKHQADAWILGKEKKQAGAGGGIYMPLTQESRAKMMILKTEWDCDTWQQFIDLFLYYEQQARNEKK